MGGLDEIGMRLNPAHISPLDPMRLSAASEHLV